MVMKIIGIALFAGSVIYTSVDVIGLFWTLFAFILVALWLLFAWLISGAIGSTEANKDEEIEKLKSDIEKLKKQEPTGKHKRL
ncbi:hypothetical protein [Citrobacter sp. Cpo150]|uniref:hypothetical protein n=1 Tax=Citrobacter sp. Cpo150 TaxID=2985154 RepID=UPI00257720BF|nr:hypothetical protein [Citrobacter sp. Cpo150]MDM2765754.1 hypothetical protein [Citrobacter sp. Cpo150]